MASAFWHGWIRRRSTPPTGGWNVPHDIGRWWDAVLRLKACTAFGIPEHLKAAMLRNLDRFTDNPDGILLAGRAGMGAAVLQLH